MTSPEDKAATAETAQTLTGASGQGVNVSIFGIIVVGLIAGLVVGLITSPNFTLQGFFLGFAGGALITVAIYFFSTPKSRTAR
ncbi:MAG TPA: hypothetical protein VE955_00820 [Candidatus Dormibacteraeota bacterium]|nr:hypothetical protein [Candidatus Dormibacteraeota bacterium]